MTVFETKESGIKLKSDDESLIRNKIPFVFEGQIFKNYKELCAALGLKPAKGGKSKLLQKKEIERFLDLEKQGQKLIVKEVYSVPKDSLDKRSKYSKDIMSILASSLSFYMESMKKDDIDIVCKPNTLLFAIGMESKYAYSRETKSKTFQSFLKKNKLTFDQYNTFHYDTRNVLYDYLNTALNAMQRECFLFYSKEYLLITDREVRFLNYKEIEKYMEIKRDTIYSFNEREPGFIENPITCNSMGDVIKNRKVSEFYSRLRENLSFEFGSGSCVYIVYNIHTTKKLLDYAKLTGVNKNGLKETITRLNNKLQESIKNKDWIFKRCDVSPEQKDSLVDWEIAIKKDEAEARAKDLLTGKNFTTLEEHKKIGI